MKFSLIIPLWNEEKNVKELIRVINESDLPRSGMAELVLVNNGSNDKTGALIEEAAKEFPWIVPVSIYPNQNYGGGVYEGFKHAKSEIFCYIPGDLQVMPDDVIRVYRHFCAQNLSQKLFVKGHRTTRFDPLQTRIISFFYTLIANLALDLRVKDANGLPKMFHRELIDLVPVERVKSFVFDSQILSLARVNNWIIQEVPVTFHSRRQGISSWSKKKIKTYIQVFCQILKLRKLRYDLGFPLNPNEKSEAELAMMKNPVRSAKLEDMVGGWFVGDFYPSILRSKNFEVAVKFYKAGDKEDWHVHKIGTEITVVLNGSVRMNETTYNHGEMILLEPTHGTAFEALTDVTTVVVKTPSALGDKYKFL